MKFSELIDYSSGQIRNLSGSSLREAYQLVKKSVNSRVKTFKSHGEETAIPAGLRSGLAVARGRSDEELLQDIREALSWARGKTSTWKGYTGIMEDRRKRMQEALPDIDLSDRDKLKKFGEFMNDIRARYGEMSKIASSQARKLYSEAERLNIDPEAFKRNLDYWLGHAEELERSDPIRTRSDRKIQPSEYARKLGLEKINGGKRR